MREKDYTEHGANQGGCIAGVYPSTFHKAPHILAVNFPILSLGSERAQQLSSNGA